MSSFLTEALRSPLGVATIAPSGRALSRAISATVPSGGDPVVVELGPGSGPVTEVIQRRLHGRGRHIAIELSPRFAEPLADRFPSVEVICDDAAKIAVLLAERGISAADIVVSTLPWVAHGSSGTDVIDGVVAALAPDGAFTQVALTALRWAPPARRLRRSLETHFDEVVVGRSVWSNIPPALVYYCRRPVVPGRPAADAARHDHYDENAPR